MQIVPLNPVPNQTLAVSLAGQNCQITLRTTAYGLFMDLYSSNQAVVLGVICQNLNRIVRSLYLGFAGDFVFLDTQGESDPVYTGLGAQFQLIYLSPDEVLAGAG